MDNSNSIEYKEIEDNETDVKIAEAKKNIERAKNTMMDNIQQIVDRGDRIDVLVDNTEDLNQNSLKFYQSSKKLKCRMFLENAKCTSFAILAILIVIFFIVVSACGGFKFDKC